MHFLVLMPEKWKPMFTQNPIHECPQQSFIHNSPKLGTTYTNWYSYAMEHYWAINMNELLTYTTNWLNLRGTMLSEKKKIFKVTQKTSAGKVTPNTCRAPPER